MLAITKSKIQIPLVQCPKRLYHLVFEHCYLLLMCLLIFISNMMSFAVHAQSNTPILRSLNQAQLQQLLVNKSIISQHKKAQWKRYHLANGHIHYSDNQGKTENGYWRIENDLYCANWPPSELWNCYIVYQNPDNTLIFKSVYGENIYSADLLH